MFTRKRIVLGMAGAVGLAVSGAALSAPPGDHPLVYKPKRGAVAESTTPQIFWQYKAVAEGYLIDLVGKNTDYRKCNGATVKQMYISAADAKCGQANTTTEQNGDGGFPAGTPLCSWTAPSLASGKYSVNVIPVSFSGDLTGLPPFDFVFRTSNLISGQTCANGNFQGFEVQAATQPPPTPEIIQPVNGVDCSTATGASGGLPGGLGCRPAINNVQNSTASWYQIWINDKNGVPVQNKWYKASQLSCSVAGGVKKCAFPAQDAKLTAIGSPFKFWVRGWNPAGNSSWTAPETFTEDGIFTD